LAGKKAEQLDLIKLLDFTLDLIKKAKKFNKSLKGTNNYAKIFQENQANAILSISAMRGALHGASKEIKESLDEIEKHVKKIFDLSASNTSRLEAIRIVRLNLKTQILPYLNQSKQFSVSDNLFPFEIVENTKPIIERIALQASGNYDMGWYDSCAVMCRRLLEILIIECFENKKIASKIKDSDKNFFFLDGLIKKLFIEDGHSWSLSRNSKKALKILKTLGDQSAHSRYFSARQGDIDYVRNDFRIVIEELIDISDLKK